MDQVYVREAFGEVLIMLDRHVGDKLNALEEAKKILEREIIRERHSLGRDLRGQFDPH